uniref:hypothetical protein n=1 Tax=Prevotella sp. TaxID=59823 RepID=UPI004027C43D
MKKDYILPTIFFIKYEEESKLLSNSPQGDADSVHAAPDVDNNSMKGNTELNIDNTGNISEGDYAKKADWFFDGNAFSDF